MNALYNLSIVSLKMILRNRNITLNWLLQTVDMWLSKLSLLSIVIPKISNSHFPGKEILWSVWPIIKAWCFLQSYKWLLNIPVVSILTSPEYARPSTVCSDPWSFLQPKWKWSCSSLNTLSPRGPPVSNPVPLSLSIANVGAWPLLVSNPLTFPFLLSQVKLSSLRSGSFTTVLVAIFMGDWAFLEQSWETLFQSSGPKANNRKRIKFACSDLGQEYLVNCSN